MQSQDPKNKFNDPARHAAERLAAFLSSLTEQLQDPKYPDRAAIKKPKKLLKALLPWLQKRQQASTTSFGSSCGILQCQQASKPTRLLSASRQILMMSCADMCYYFVLASPGGPNPVRCPKAYKC
jgi:hypothetical protein